MTVDALPVRKHNCCHLLFKALLQVGFELCYLLYNLNIMECKNGVKKCLFESRDKWESSAYRASQGAFGRDVIIDKLL